MRKKFNELRQTPIYKRERGEFGGNPNPVYEEVRRYTPLVVIGMLVISVCCGGNTLTSLTGASGVYAGLVALSCLPNFIAQVLTWVALFLVPPLIAPTVAEEKKRGTWEILRLTPYPARDILLAKVLGGLSRLNIWWVLLVLNGVQLTISLIAIAILAQDSANLFFLFFVPTIILSSIRPWIEIGFAAMVSLIVSTFTESARGALISTYSIVLVMKFFTNPAFWLLLGIFISEELLALPFDQSEAAASWIAPGAPALIFLLGLGLAWIVFRRRAYLLDL